MFILQSNICILIFTSVCVLVFKYFICQNDSLSKHIAAVIIARFYITTFLMTHKVGKCIKTYLHIFNKFYFQLNIFSRTLLHRSPQQRQQHGLYSNGIKSFVLLAARASAKQRLALLFDHAERFEFVFTIFPHQVLYRSSMFSVSFIVKIALWCNNDFIGRIIKRNNCNTNSVAHVCSMLDLKLIISDLTRMPWMLNALRKYQTTNDWWND